MSTISKFLAQPKDNFSTQISTASLGTTDLTFNVDSASGLTTEGIGQFFKKDANGEIVSGSVEFLHWTGVAGNTITLSDVNDRGITGSDSGAQSYVADDYFEVWASSYYVGGVGGLIEHNADGTHSSSIATLTGTQTLTNKRNTKRIGSTTSSATPTINTNSVDIYRLTAQAADITSFTTNLSGTPSEGDMLLIEITGTAARAITWGTSFEASTVALPITTVTTAMLQVLFKWNSVTSKWRCLASI